MRHIWSAWGKLHTALEEIPPAPPFRAVTQGLRRLRIIAHQPYPSAKRDSRGGLPPTALLWSLPLKQVVLLPA